MKRTRKSHPKSRNGCSECKRRRLKCDENRPSCLRCVRLLTKCVYLPASTPFSRYNEDGDIVMDTTLSESSPSKSSHSAISPPYSDSLVALEQPPRPTTGSSTTFSDTADAPNDLSESGLRDYFIQHTSGTLTHLRQERDSPYCGIIELASRSKTVHYAMLAVTAACLCCDLISNIPPPSTKSINEILMTGYQFYNLASAKIRESLSNPDPSELENLLASAGLLVPFGTSTQQIKHWISTHSTVSQDPAKPLSTTPRDVITFLRGIKAMREALPYHTFEEGSNGNPEHEASIEIPKASISQMISAPWRNHPIYSIVASTSQKAFTMLEEHLTIALSHQDNAPNESLAACWSAFHALSKIRSNTFDFMPSTNDNLVHYAESPRYSPSRLAPWLRSSIEPEKLLATEPLTVYLLTFLVDAPQAYMDLILPLLDQRLENPKPDAEPISFNLTSEQALGLDIYAHWTILMMLIEDESWWVGNLADVTLEAMINTYGTDFVSKFWPVGEVERLWWPGYILKTLREVKLFL